jgi:hypothetical protein
MKRSTLRWLPERLTDAFNTTPIYTNGTASADLNGDNAVNILDPGLLADRFGKEGDPITVRIA